MSLMAPRSEEQWIAQRPMDTAMAVDVAATAAGLVAMVAARRRAAMPAAAATALEMRLLMAYWQLMARYYDRNVGVSLTVLIMTLGAAGASPRLP